MRVVILYNTSWYVYLLRRNLIKALQEVGCEVVVVAPRDNYTARLLNLGVRHISLPLHPGSTNPLMEVQTIRSLLKILRYLKPDVVLSFTVKCNLYAGLCKRVFPFAQVANISGLGAAFEQRGALMSVVKALYCFALKHTEHLFFQNKEDLNTCVREGLIEAENATVIPGSGVDLAAFTPISRRSRRPRTFLIFGRLLPQKGYDLYLRAAATLRSEFGEQVVFWILGSPDTHREESLELHERILLAHAQGTIRYLQSTDDVRPILEECDVVVLPSTYNEGVPRSLLEALAAGKVIVTTNWKGCRETVQHGINGYLVKPHDDLSLISALRELITCSDEQLDKFSTASRHLAETHFDEGLVLEKYLSALNLPMPSTLSESALRPTGTGPT